MSHQAHVFILHLQDFHRIRFTVVLDLVSGMNVAGFTVDAFTTVIHDRHSRRMQLMSPEPITKSMWLTNKFPFKNSDPSHQSRHRPTDDLTIVWTKTSSEVSLVSQTLMIKERTSCTSIDLNYNLPLLAS